MPHILHARATLPRIRVCAPGMGPGEWGVGSGQGRDIGVGLKESFYLRPSFYPKTHPVF